MYISNISMSVVSQCKLKYMDGSHGMAYEDDPLCYDLPSVYLFPLNSSSLECLVHISQDTILIQYANLEDKEITKRLAIYCDQGSTAVTIHPWRQFSVTSGRSTDFHRGDSGLGGRKTEGAGRKAKWIFWIRDRIFFLEVSPVHTSCGQYCKYSDNKSLSQT